MVWYIYRMVKNFEDIMFIRFGRMYERDGHTHRHRPHIGRACIASRGKKYRVHEFVNRRTDSIDKE